jgi:WD40 repeat protein
MQGDCTILEGHTNKVRPLAWNYEFPYLLISGSWDATIRVWNVPEKKSIHISKEHSSDIYGIVAHKERPFIYFTCSRDNSLRRWNLAAITDKIQVKYFFTLN